MIKIPKADPEGLVEELDSYDRVHEVAESSKGSVSAITGIHDGKPYPIHRIMKDLTSTVDVIGYGYVITQCRPIRAHWLDTPYKDRPTVYRLAFESLPKLLVYSQFGYYTHSGKRIDKPPSKP